MDSEAKPGIFLPPAMRGGNRRGETMMPSSRKDETTIRVSNLPDSMSETDMQELCNPFGKVERIFLAKDRYVKQLFPQYFLKRRIECVCLI